METNETKENVKELITHSKEYLSLRAELIILQFKKITAELIAKSSSSLIIVALLLMAFLFGSLSLGFYLSAHYGSYTIGFLYLSLGYLGLTMISLLLRKNIKNIIMDSMIKVLFKSDENEDI